MSCRAAGALTVPAGRRLPGVRAGKVEDAGSLPRGRQELWLGTPVRAENLKTPELCIVAVRQDAQALKFVPEALHGDMAQTTRAGGQDAGDEEEVDEGPRP